MVSPSAPGSKDEMLAATRCFPLFTQQRTSLNRVGMSVRCHQRKLVDSSHGCTARVSDIVKSCGRRICCGPLSWNDQ